MRTIMARSPHESSFSFSKRHFQWIIGKNTGGEERAGEKKNGESEEETLPFSTTVSSSHDEEAMTVPAVVKKKKSSSMTAATAVSKFRLALTAAIAVGRNRPNRVTGTLFGHRRGHVHFAFQVDSRSSPVVLIELAMPTSTLVREMASGLVRIALECERRGFAGSGSSGKKTTTTAAAAAGGRLLEETLWRAYCNGKKCGYAVRRECGPGDWRVLKAVEPVSMGAGVLPAVDGGGGGGGEGEMMYMRAKFERVVGSKDSEAFYMMNPDGNGGPELSIYLLRV